MTFLLRQLGSENAILDTRVFKSEHNLQEARRVSSEAAQS